MKKRLCLLLCLLICLSLISCVKQDGEDHEESNASLSNEETQEIQNAENQLAMQAYIDALNNEIPVVLQDTAKGSEEVYFQTAFPLSHDSYCMFDMDHDGVDEMILNPRNAGKFVLRYEKNTVYVYRFSYAGMSQIFSDGSFSWYHSERFDNGHYFDEHGFSRISFSSGRLKIEELCRVENNAKYYISGEEVTEKQYNKYTKGMGEKPLSFTNFDLLSTNAKKAIEISEKHWGVTQGFIDEKTGYRYRLIAYKSGDAYHVCLYWFKNNAYERLQCISVDVDTGEVSLLDIYDHGKG